MRCTSIDELSVVEANTRFSILDSVLSKLKGGSVVSHSSLFCLDRRTWLVLSLGSLVDKVLAHDNGSGSILLVELPALLQAGHALGVCKLTGFFFRSLHMGAKGSRNKTSGLLGKVETRDTEEQVSSSVLLVYLDSALPSFPGGIVMSETPKTETDTKTRIRTSPSEGLCIVTLLVRLCLDEDAHFECLLVELEGRSILSLSKEDASFSEQSKGVSRILIEDGIKDDGSTIVLASGGEEDSFGELVDVVLWVKCVGRRLVDGGLAVERLLELLVGETLIACVLKDKFRCIPCVVESERSEKSMKRDGLGRLVRSKHLNTLSTDLNGFWDAILDVELRSETSPVLGGRTFVGERFQEDLNVLCGGKRVEIERDGLVDCDRQVDGPIARRHGCAHTLDKKSNVAALSRLPDRPSIGI